MDMEKVLWRENDKGKVKKKKKSKRGSVGVRAVMARARRLN